MPSRSSRPSSRRQSAPHLDGQVQVDARAELALDLLARAACRSSRTMLPAARRSGFPSGTRSRPTAPRARRSARPRGARAPRPAPRSSAAPPRACASAPARAPARRATISSGWSERSLLGEVERPLRQQARRAPSRSVADPRSLQGRDRDDLAHVDARLLEARGVRRAPSAVWPRDRAGRPCSPPPRPAASAFASACAMKRSPPAAALGAVQHEQRGVALGPARARPGAASAR